MKCCVSLFCWWSGNKLQNEPVSVFGLCSVDFITWQQQERNSLSRDTSGKPLQLPTTEHRAQISRIYVWIIAWLLLITSKPQQVRFLVWCLPRACLFLLQYACDYVAFPRHSALVLRHIDLAFSCLFTIRSTWTSQQTSRKRVCTFVYEWQRVAQACILVWSMRKKAIASHVLNLSRETRFRAWGCWFGHMCNWFKKYHKHLI